MNLSVISFTENGMNLSKKAAEMLEQEVSLYTKCRACRQKAELCSVLTVEESVGEWAKMQMQRQNAILFIGACGIAVRAIAPHLTDKLKDVPVLVMDEAGRYIIPVLSGHMGGANELAVYLAGKLGAEPVITTATDINRKFAVDLFAKRNGLFITDKRGIAAVSSKVLAGEEVSISIEPGHRQDAHFFPEGIKPAPYPPNGFTDIVVTSEEGVFDTSVLLKPQEYIIGMGCKKGKCSKEIEDFISEKLRKLGILETQIFALASIVQKKEEPGICRWCQKRRIPFLTYTAEELKEVKGEFKTSSFVKNTVGVDNVCERAALKACEKGELVLEKCIRDGMTIAIAKREWKVDFYDE